MNEINEDSGIKILSSEELLSGVVQKHRRFLEEYRQGFEELDSRLNLIEGEIKSSKDSRSQIIERKEILKEKRHLMYYQAEALLKELYPAIEPRTTSKLEDEIKKLKGQIGPEEEKKLAEEFITMLREAVKKAELEENRIQQINTKIEEAKASNQEFKEIEESEKQLNEDFGSKNKELSRDRPQHKRLNSKIKSHEEALKYWESLKA